MTGVQTCALPISRPEDDPVALDARQQVARRQARERAAEPRQRRDEADGRFARHELRLEGCDERREDDAPEVHEEHEREQRPEQADAPRVAPG